MAEKAPSEVIFSEVPVVNKDLEDTSDIEQDNTKFPKAVYFIIPNEFCERFCFYGIKNLLNLYLQHGFHYSKAFAKSQVHLFNGLVYGFPLAGAAISDSFLGKYYTIVILSVVYLIGNILLSILSINGIAGTYGEYPYWSFMVPLILVAIGTGGIKPCVASHGGDQFGASQTLLLDRFFSLFYLSINVGSLIAQYLTPFLKDKVTCFGSDCYFLAFGVPTIFFGLALIVFVMGYRYYRIAPPSGEFLPLKAVKTTYYAGTEYYRATPAERAAKSHWLNFAESYVGPEFVEETRLLGKVIVMFIPLIFFWVLYDQNATEWQNQYQMMNHKFLWLVNIPTEASSNINSVLIISFVPLLSYVIYPALERRNIKLSILGRMIWGFIFTILAFIVSVVLQYYVEKTYQMDQLLYPGSEECINCINGTWQLPQWILISLGEAMLSPTGVQFAYTQVGPQMKASASSIWLLTTAFGNYIVMALELVIGEMYGPIRQSIYIVIATVFLFFFMVLSKYWYVTKEEEDAQRLAKLQTESLRDIKI